MEKTRKGICVAGNIIVDKVYPIHGWPRPGELSDIADAIKQCTGGALCNTIIDLAKLDATLPLTAVGRVGNDDLGDFVLDDLNAYPNIELSQIKREGLTSFTIVMSDQITKQRTFFTYAGASGKFCEADIDWDAIDAELFHIGYIFLLPALDEPDDRYGTKMARLLHSAKQHGLKTSIDIVSKVGQPFEKVVPPSLQYTDYCIINELEAEQTTGIPLRAKDGALMEENIPAALQKLLDYGVSTWAVIHCPEGGYGMEKNSAYTAVPGVKLPAGFIKDSVGAGDAFCAGVLYGAWQKKSMGEALRLGNAAAICSLSEYGSFTGLRTAGEADELYCRLQKETAK